MRIKCPMCGEELNVPDGVVEGQHVYCSSCKTKFSYSESMKEGGGAEPPAYQIIKCKECGQKIVVGDGIQEGQHVRCPFCDKKFSYSAEVEKEEEEKHDKLVKCASCGEIIVVDESIEIGQHILCPYCDKKFSYVEKDSEISKQLKIVKNQKSSLGKIDLDLSEKKEVVRIKAKYEDKARHREWKRTTITRVIAFTGVFLALVACVVAYFVYHAAINTRIEVRNALALYISENSKVLSDKHSQYSMSIRECRNGIWQCRDDEDRSYKYRREILRFESAQREIDAIINAFAEVAPRLDSMSTTELKVSQAGLAMQMQSLIARINKIGFSPPVFPATSKIFEELKKEPAAEVSAKVVQDSVAQTKVADTLPKSETVVEQPVAITVTPSQAQGIAPNAEETTPVETTRNRDEIDPSRIDALIAELKRANYSFDPESLKQYNLPMQKMLLEEMLEDVKMLKRKKETP